MDEPESKHDTALEAYEAITSQIEAWSTPYSERSVGVYSGGVSTPGSELRPERLLLLEQDDMEAVEEKTDFETFPAEKEEVRCSYEALLAYLDKTRLEKDPTKCELEFLERLISCAKTPEASDVWRLIRRLRIEGLDYFLFHEISVEVMPQDVKASPMEIYQRLVSPSSKVSPLRRTYVLLQWMEECLRIRLRSQFFPPKSRDTMWPDTLHSLFRGTCPTNCKQQMHPDAKGDIIKTDKAEDHQLLECYFRLLQAGQTEEAAQMCKDVGQPWRAAAYTQDLRNPAYYLHKYTCYRSAHSISREEPPADPYEVAIYAFLSDQIQLALPCCKTWMEGLHLHFHAGLHRRIDGVLLQHSIQRHAGGKRFPYAPSYLESQKRLFEATESNAELSPEEICTRLVNLYNLTQVEQLLSSVIVGAPSLVQFLVEYSDEDGISPTLMTHLVLYLSIIAPSLLESQILNRKLLHYIQKTLVPNANYWPFVSLYTSMLPEPLLIQTYVEFLLPVQDPKQQELLLKKARESFREGLDLIIVSQVVSSLLEDTSESLLALPMDDTPQLPPTLTPTDYRKMEAIAWLSFYPEHYSGALYFTNALLRQFLLQNEYYKSKLFLQDYFLKMDAVRILADEEEEASETVNEFAAIRSLLSAHSAYEHWRHVFTSSRSSSPKSAKKLTDVEQEISEKMEFLSKKHYDAQILKLAQDAEEQWMNVITYPGGWLSNFFPEDDGKHKDELQRLQKQCLPLMVFALYSLYSDMGDRLSSKEWYEKALVLGDVIARDEYGLCECFTPKEMERLLGLLAECSVEILRFEQKDVRV